MEEKELRQIFYNKFDCYTDVDRGEGYKSEMAMSEETFIEVVKLILPVVSKSFKTELEMHEIATEKYHEHNYGDAKYDGFMECYRMLVKEEKQKINLSK